MSKLLWWCAWATYTEELNDHLHILGELSQEAKEDLLHYPIQTWCRAFFDTVCKNQKVENNFTESFNSWILAARNKPIIGMLEEIRIKVMEMVKKNEEEVMRWTSEWSPKALEIFNDYSRIANMCVMHFNGDYGFEVGEGNDKHIVQLENKRCTCRVWDLTGIPCPHAIKALVHKKLDPVNEIHWWHSKEAYLLAYHHKLQPVPGPKFWKIDPTQAMEPPTLVNLAGRPKLKREREKDEAVKRQTGWAASRKGRVMTCSTCGVPGHNAGGCKKLDKKSGEETSKSKKPIKRRSRLIDEEPPRSPLAQNVEDLPLSAPQATQNSPPRQSFFGQSMLDPLASDPDSEDEQDLSLRPRGISEFNSRILQRIKQPLPTRTRQIIFRGDAKGLSMPSDLYAPKGSSFKGQSSITGRQLEQLRVEKQMTGK